MDTIYWIIMIALMLLASFDLINGVANDAVNFLNSAIGSKAAPVRVILTVASIGVLIGAVLSSGMMEIARSGIFNPGMFTFHEVMFLFLGVMIAEVILLDTFNTFGLPTSTTVSLVFGLLGSSVATSLFKIYSDSGKNALGLLEYINTDKCIEIISGILLSVVIAFTVGTIVMWVSRLAFSFRYQKPFLWVGSLWCGLGMTAICYFALFKGMKSMPIMNPEFLAMLDKNMGISLLLTFIGCSAFMAILQHLFMVNILKLTVLAGTFSLALAFAGNDLVNFIGVFMGGLGAFQIAMDHVAAGGSLAGLHMGQLAGEAHANPMILLTAGGIMVLALWFSKKARSVIATGVELSRQGDGGIERFGSVPPARAIVRSAIAMGAGVKKLIPGRMLVRINHRWNPAPIPLESKDRVAFDLIRATVNLTVAAMLITWATSYKLPLSTTYVTFMVAMGSSLADKAWGRESAVYRVTGVLTVISGWFMTGLAAFTMAGIMAIILHYGQGYAIFPMLALTVFILVKSAVLHRHRESKFSQERFDEITEDNIIDVCNKQVSDSVSTLTKIYSETLDALIQQDRKALKELASDAEDLATTSKEHHKYDILPVLYKMQSRSLDTGYHFVQALDHLNEAVASLQQFTDFIFSYVDNNHTPLTVDQTSDLKEVHQEMLKLLNDVSLMLKTSNYSKFDFTVVAQEQLLQLIARATKRQIKRAQRNQTRTRSSILYLNMLQEIRFMAVQLRALANDQRNFVTA
ncbi:inorganic phosphate transporter [Akkermansia sp. N21116]|uniref:inorganic phosphate transporter n=2 Tax=unclassified Akkermansia TaxID=2608915 RepID=UPI00244EE51F|nr:inorganic phosphate transporter [Akkermansia sp. N21116]WPX39527.1 inorganic phosphate transporter [Akkermansia sp. N21116]